MASNLVAILGPESRPPKGWLLSFGGNVSGLGAAVKIQSSTSCTTLRGGSSVEYGASAFVH